MNYVATFHTHLSAMLSCQALSAAAVPARMSPVPRQLSSSCGTCVRYKAETDRRELLDQDLEAVFEAAEEGYRLVFRKDS